MQMPAWTCLNQLIAGSGYCRAIRYLASTATANRTISNNTAFPVLRHALCSVVRAPQCSLATMDRFDEPVAWIGRCGLCLFMHDAAQLSLDFHLVCYQLWWARKSGSNCVRKQNRNSFIKYYNRWKVVVLQRFVTLQTSVSY